MRLNTRPAEGPDGLAYQCRLELSTTTVDLVAGLIRDLLKKIGSRWRKLAPGKIALIVLAVLRHDQRLLDMAGGNGVSASTVRCWTLEVIELLAARAPRLDRALKKIARKGGVVVLLYGTLVRTRRRTGDENRPNYSGKHKAHGLLFLALTCQGSFGSRCSAGAGAARTRARHGRLGPGRSSRPSRRRSRRRSSALPHPGTQSQAGARSARSGLSDPRHLLRRRTRRARQLPRLGPVDRPRPDRAGPHRPLAHRPGTAALGLQPPRVTRRPACPRRTVTEGS